MTNASLREIAERRLFICYRLIFAPGKAKPDKLPVHHETGHAINPHDRSLWLTLDEAEGFAAGLGDNHGIALVLHKGCGFVCIDIDGAWNGTEWSALAQGLCARFAGCATEVSVSGTGLHIFVAYTGELPEHRSKDTALHLECYSDVRFIALNPDKLNGSFTLDRTAELLAFIAEYMPARVDARDAAWTDYPHPDWQGITDNPALIAKMRATKSIAQVMGSKASFEQLWTNDADALAHHYPSQGEDYYDRSSADLALANYLAFWTGNDCERMESLMWGSELVRDKWERRDYIEGTILRACSGTRSFHKLSKRERVAPTPPREPPPRVELAGFSVPLPPAQPADGLLPVPPPPPPPATALEAAQAPGAMITGAQQVEFFRGMIYIQDMRRMLMPSGVLLDEKRFDEDASVSGYEYLIDDVGNITKSPWEAFTQSRHSCARLLTKVRGLCFDPPKPLGTIIERGGALYANSYKPITIRRVKGDASPFVNHVRMLYPHGRDAEILISWLATMFQNVGVKARCHPILIGPQGCGKSTIARVARYCAGPQYTHSPRASRIGAQFNAALDNKLLIIVDDIDLDENDTETMEALKPILTEDTIEVEYKGVDAVTRDSRANWIFTTNNPTGVRITRASRRFMVFWTAQRTVDDMDALGLRDGKYFNALNEWLEADGFAIAYDYLMSYDIPAEFNYTLNGGNAPETTSTAEIVLANEGQLEQGIKEAISNGDEGFRDDWINGDCVDVLITQLHRSRSISKRKRGAILAEMGYVPHPALTEGRPHNKLPGGKRPVIYVKRSRADLLALNTPVAVVAAYLAAQRA